MTSNSYDAVIIGAGHNGLVCACYLAKSGRRVLILEADEQPGGAARTREFAENYRVSAGAHFVNMLNPSIAADLNLSNHGLGYAARDLKSIVLGRAGSTLSIAGASATGGDISADDRIAFTKFHRRMLKFAGILAKACDRRPPKLVDTDFKDKFNLMRLGWDVRRLGRDDMRELLRIGLINIYDLANDNFEHPLLKAGIAMDAVLGSHMGPRSPNTVLGYLYRRMGDVFGFTGPAIPRGGLGKVAEALVKEAAGRGVELRTGVEVVSIDIVDGRAQSVTLASGEKIAADVIVANTDPKTTFVKLVGLPQLETGFARRVHNIRMRGDAAKLHLALDALPEFSGVQSNDLGNRLLLAPDMEYIERAFNPAKYGEYSPEPVMEISIPTVHDDSLAPPGKHVMSATVQYAPHQLKAGWDSSRESYQALLIETLERAAPGIGGLIRHSELLTPKDLETEFRTWGGHWHHGEISLDQMLMLRPVPGAAQYTTPIDRLYLCGAGAHPGGGILGLAGRNAAREVLSGEKVA